MEKCRELQAHEDTCAEKPKKSSGRSRYSRMRNVVITLPERQPTGGETDAAPHPAIV